MTVIDLHSAFKKLCRSARERSLPSQLDRYVYKKGLVNRLWYLKLKARNALSGKTRVGIGPIHVNESNLGGRKWRIDPIVDYINANSSKYVCDIFFDGDDLLRFDVVLFVKYFARLDVEAIAELRKRRTRLIYDALDVRLIPTPQGERDIYADPEVFKRYFIPYLEMMDCIIVTGPTQKQDLDGYGFDLIHIEHPVINRCFKQTYDTPGPIQIIWQGKLENMQPMERLHETVSNVRQETGKDARLVYHTDMPTHDDGFVRYIAWRIFDWDKVLADCDIAVVIKPLDDPFQQRKPSTKVLTYMAAGLPVICTPTEADKHLIEHGKTGFFAYSDEDWFGYLRDLVNDRDLRQRVGQAARHRVYEDFCLDKIVEQYLQQFDRLIAANADH